MQGLIFQLKLAFQLRDSFWWLSFKGEPIVGTSLLLSKEWKVGSDQLCLVIHSWFITLRGWFYKIRLKLEGWSNQMGPISHFIHCYWTCTGALPMTPLLSASPPQGWLLLLVWAQRRWTHSRFQWLRSFSFCDQNVGYASPCLAFIAVMPEFSMSPWPPWIQTIPCNNPHYKRDVFSPHRKPWIFGDTGIQFAVSIV